MTKAKFFLGYFEVKYGHTDALLNEVSNNSLFFTWLIDCKQVHGKKSARATRDETVVCGYSMQNAVQI